MESVGVGESAAWSPLHPVRQATLGLEDVVPVPSAWSAGVGGPGWWTLPDLLGGDGAVLDEMLVAVGRAYETRSRAVMAQFFLDGYAWYVVGLAVGPYVAARRVPDLVTGVVACRFDHHGGVEEVALADGWFACLPTDPVAGHGDAVVVADAAALRASLRRGITAHLAPLVTALTTRSSLRERSLWFGVADHTVRLYLSAALHLDPVGCAASCEVEAAELVGDEPPLRGPTGVMWVREAGRPRPWIRRAGCCQGYRVASHGRCDHCPAYPLAERITRVESSLAASP